MIHECWECGGSIAESEKHDSGFEESHGGNECSLPLVLFLNTDVIISPSDVKLGEQSGFFHVIDEFWDEGEWVGIPDSVGVQVMAVLAWV